MQCEATFAFGNHNVVLTHTTQSQPKLLSSHMWLLKYVSAIMYLSLFILTWIQTWHSSLFSLIKDLGHISDNPVYVILQYCWAFHLNSQLSPQLSIW